MSQTQRLASTNIPTFNTETNINSENTTNTTNNIVIEQNKICINSTTGDEHSSSQHINSNVNENPSTSSTSLIITTTSSSNTKNVSVKDDKSKKKLLNGDAAGGGASTDSNSTFELIDIESSPDTVTDEWCPINNTGKQQQSCDIIPSQTIASGNIVSENNDNNNSLQSSSNDNDTILSPESENDQFELDETQQFSSDDITEEMHDNNKLFRRNINAERIRSTASSKEEKQRQNEEIVILESSSISSETGSWESVFPQPVITTPTININRSTTPTTVTNGIGTEKSLASPSSVTITATTAATITTTTTPPSVNIISNLKDTCQTFLSNERNYSVADECLAPQIRSKNGNSTSSIGACFIDASSLFDETELILLHPSITPPPAPPSSQRESMNTNNNVFKEFAVGQQYVRLDNLNGNNETTNNSQQNKIEEKSTTHDNGTEKDTRMFKENLSDEQKLLNRNNSTEDTKIEYDIKDQFSLVQPSTIIGPTTSSGTTTATSSLVQRQDTYEILDDNTLKLRQQQEQEKKQGNFLFKNSIQQFSGHLINSDKNPLFDHQKKDDYHHHHHQYSGVGVVNGNGGQHETITKDFIHFESDNVSIAGTESRLSENDYPDTPHNSIVNIESSEGHSSHNGRIVLSPPPPPPTTTTHPQPKLTSTQPSSSSTSSIPPQSESLNSNISPPSTSSSAVNGIRIPKRTLKCDESAPIVSGGASIKDFSPKCESPIVRRKTETCPIVSGGFTSMNFNNDDDDNDDNDNVDNDNENNKRSNKKSNFNKHKISALSSWIVDMSDCSSYGRRNRSESSSSSNTTDNASITTNRSSGACADGGGGAGAGYSSTNSSSNKIGGLGFYVSLDDMKPIKKNDNEQQKLDFMTTSSTSTATTASSIEPTLMMKRSTGFYIDLSENEHSRTNTPPPTQQLTRINSTISAFSSGTTTTSTTAAVVAPSTDKKNMFSMFIDFGEKKEISTKDQHLIKSKLSSTLINNLNNNNKNNDIEIIESHQEQFIKNNINRLVINGGSNNCDNIITATNSSEIISDNCVAPKTSNSTNPTNYMFIESDSPVIRRSHSPSSNTTNRIAQRHSWNQTTKDKLDESITTMTSNHKRSSSLSTDKGIMNILDKIPLITKTSNQSIDDNSEISTTYSNNSMSSVNSNNKHFKSNNNNDGDDDADDDADDDDEKNKSENQRNRRQRRHRKDVKINETFDKSSQGSLTDGILSKTSTPTSTTTTDDTDDITFQNDVNDTVLNRSQIMMETIVETKEHFSPRKQQNYDNDKTKYTMEALQATIEKQKLLLETVTEEMPPSTSSFVKLSDLDKPPPPPSSSSSQSTKKFELHQMQESTMSKSVGSNRISKVFLDSKYGVHRTTWSNMSLSAGNNLTNLASSVENLRSLSRLFPHLSKDLSNSLPADIPMDILNKTTNDNHEYLHSDLSCTSSLTSSFSRSGIDSADESSLSCRQPRRLGEDLLKMFLQEIATDVVVEVNGRRMRAHKCILRSRCQYFAAILAGGWVQSAGNVISITGYSYGAVHFALCHIYSGAAHPPDGISLMELAALADLLGLEGLKEVTSHALKTNYCHNFHKPCSGCVEGIVQVFPITLNHGLDDLYRKCLRWVCKYYIKVWPTRQFSQLPPDLIIRCRQHIVAHLTSETVLNVLLDCDQLLSSLAPCRWAIHIENTVRDIIDSAHAYVFDHFASLIASDGFLSLGHGQSWNISRLENLLLRISSTLTPEQACKSYQRVSRLNAVLGVKVLTLTTPFGLHLNNNENGDIIIDDEDDPEDEMNWNPAFIRLVSAILTSVEQCLIRQCSRAMRNNQWARMDIDLRKKIQKLACLSDPVTSSATIRSRSINTNNKSPVTTYTPITSQNNRSQDLYQVKLAIQAHSKRTQSQDTQLYRASAHTQTNNYERNATHTFDKGCQASHEPRPKERAPSKILKSSSHTQVPDLIPTIAKQHNKGVERSQSFGGHRRSKSETVPKTFLDNKQSVTTNNERTKISTKLSNVKPRYLQFKNPRIDITKNQIVTNVKVNKGKQMSSSDSSTRTSSPAAANKLRKIPIIKKSIGGGNETRTMSRDSLSSPAKNSTELKSNNNNNNNHEITKDSLGDSMMSSLRTDKTLSQESLLRVDLMKSKENLTKSFSRSIPMINKELNINTINNHSNSNKTAFMAVNSNATKNLKIKKSNGNSQQTTTSSTTNSPSSSAATTKSGKLSSVSSPRDSYKGRGGGGGGGSTSSASDIPVRKSFLSAKSKEILAAKKKQVLKESVSTKSVPNTINEKINPVNKSQSTSNILYNRQSSITNNFQTTLHLRRTAKLPNTNSTILNPTQSSARKSITNHVVGGGSSICNNKIINNSNNNNINKKMVKTKPDKKSIVAAATTTITTTTTTTTAAIIQKCNIEIEQENQPQPKYENKLERSSTFCKEFSDIPNAKLQEID